MAELSKVYEFACKWLLKFSDPEVRYTELVDRFFAEDCRALGFEMDCGIAFNNRYKGAFNYTDLLKSIIGEISDIELIGSALYSQWRYYNHWAYDAAEILEPENREWFILLLKRLKSLSKDNKEENGMQLIPDLNFKTGMRLITQKDHKNNESFSVFKTVGFYGEEVKEQTARWGLAQWDSGTDLCKCLIEHTDGAVTDGRHRTFSYDKAENMMTFYLDTSAYYKGKPAVLGDYWPHLLIEQEDFRYNELDGKTKAYYNCGCKSIVLSMDIKLGDYTETATDGDWVRAAQFLLYVYAKGIDTNDFCWFGVSLFDNRWDKNDHYINYDGGKADASGAMIYLIGSKYAYPGQSLWKNGKPEPNGEWRHVELDLRPYLDDMLRHGQADGYFKAKTLDGLCLNGMNMGWETIGTFSHTMHVKNLSLISHLN